MNIKALPSMVKGHSRWLLLRADARDIPLTRNTVSFIIATPPACGVKRLGERGFCTGDSWQYERMVAALKAECLRVLKPGGYLALFVHSGNIRKPFEILQKRRLAKHWMLISTGAEIFRARYVPLPGFWWYALPVSVYSNLIKRYTVKGQVVAHVFSGSGNSAIAAAALKRPIVLIDLHYHDSTRRRLEQRLNSPA